MNWNALKGNWSQLRGSVKLEWRWLNNRDLDEIEGGYPRLVSRLQDKYGWTPEDAEFFVHDWARRNVSH